MLFRSSSPPEASEATAPPSPAAFYHLEIEAPRDLRAMIEQGLSLERWRTDAGMTPALLQRLVEEAIPEVREAAATRGWFSAKVTAAIEREREPWTVRLTIDPGEQARVRSVHIEVVGPAAEDPAARRAIDTARREFLLPPGQPFTQDLWEDAKADTARRIAAWRYAAAKAAKSEARIDPATASADLTLIVDSGPPFQFGPISVTGAQRYPANLVPNLSPLAEGETYDREKLRLYERRLNESGYFVGSTVSVDPDPARAPATPVRVAVIEGQPRSVEASLGYNSDTAINTRLRLRNQDVFGTAWRFNSELRYDEKVQSMRADLDAPPRTDGSWNNHFAALQEADIQKETTRSVSAGFAHNWGSETTPSAFTVSGTTEDQTVQAFGDASALHEKRHALYLGYRGTFRRTDDLVAPRSGYQATINVGGAPPEVSTREFARATGRLLVFVPLGRRDDLLLRAEGGYVRSTSRLGIPSAFLFRTGGDQTLRGYSFDAIGVQQGDAIVGGRRLALATAEATHWFAESWGGAAFIDAGDAWDPAERGYKAKVGYGEIGRAHV